jgi:transcriptional regulator with XRE-family HTH domain
MTELGEKLRALRSATGRTLKEVSDALGLADGHLAAIETGKIRNPRVAVVTALADYYGLNLGVLMNEHRQSELSPESLAIVRLFEETLTPALRRLILRYAQLLAECLQEDAETVSDARASTAGARPRRTGRRAESGGSHAGVSAESDPDCHAKE